MPGEQDAWFSIKPQFLLHTNNLYKSIQQSWATPHLKLCSWGIKGLAKKIFKSVLTQ